MSVSVLRFLCTIYLNNALFFQSPPFVFRVEDVNGTHYEGYAIDVLQRVAEELDFNYELIEPQDGLFGVKLENGSWNGIIRDILAGVKKNLILVYVKL